MSRFLIKVYFKPYSLYIHSRVRFIEKVPVMSHPKKLLTRIIGFA